MHRQLRPAMTMSDIYGPGCVYFPRAIDGYCDWLPQSPEVLDSLTGGQLTIAGSMPVVCSEGFDTLAGLDLLESAGLEVAPQRPHFKAGDELGALAAQGEHKVVVQHAIPAHLSRSVQAWIDPGILQYLNDKSALPELVPAEHVPPRRLVARVGYFSSNDRRLPVVLKVVSEQSNGGGCGVMICRTDDQLREAERLFESCEKIIVEEMLEIVRNPCLNLAVMPDGTIGYLGFADQDVTTEGKYRGNWIDEASPIPQEAVDVAMEPVRRGAAMGYRGIAGVDLAFTADGRMYVLDLNFRVNGCTAMILLADAVAERGGAEVMHFRKIGGALGGNDLANALAPFVASGRLVPLSLFDAVAGGYPGRAASVQALIVGPSRGDVLAVEAEVEAAIA